MELSTAINRWLPHKPSYSLDYSGVSDSWHKTRSAAIPSTAWRNSGYRTDSLILAEDAFEKVGWVYGCTRAISRNLQQIPVYAATRQRNGQPKKLPDSHPLSQLLAHPNDEEDFSGILEAAGTHLSLRGEAFWELDGVLPGENGMPRPARIFSRPPQWINKVDIENDAYARFHIRVPNDGIKRTIEGQNAVFFKYFNPREPWRGMAPMKAAYQAADSYYAAQVFNAGFFERGAVPSLVLSFDKEAPFDKVSEEQRERIRTELERFAGIKNSFGVMVTGPHEHVESLADLKDMHFGEWMKWQKEEILAVFGVPPLMLSNVENANRANSIEQRKFFWEETIVPLAQDINAQMNRKLAPRFGNVFVVFDYGQVPALRDDLESMGKGIIPLVKEGLLQINEARDKYLGIEPVPWGDEWWPDGQRFPVGENVAATVSQPLPNGGKVSAEIGQKIAREWKNSTISRIRDGMNTPMEAFPAGREAKKVIKMFGVPAKMAFDLASAVRMELAVKWDLQAPEKSVADIFDKAIEHMGDAA